MTTMAIGTKLTGPQQRYLDRVRAEGQLVLNGRARRPIEELEERGLVFVDWDSRAQVKGGGVELAQRITVTTRCGTVGHGRIPATHKITYNYRGDPETDTEFVCASCAEGYGRRVVLKNFTATKLGR